MRNIILFALVSSVAATGIAQQQPTLLEILAEVSKVKYSEAKVAEIAERWKALHTSAGYDELVSEWEKPRVEIHEISPIREACIIIQKHSKLADKDKGLVFARRAQATENPNYRVWHFRMLQSNKLDDDLIPFYTQYLDDRRSMIVSELRSPESVGEVNRVCDSAFGATLRVLERKKLIAESDPIYGDPAGEPSCSQRDEKIAILLPILEKHGLMYYQQPSAAMVNRTSAFVPAGKPPQTGPPILAARNPESIPLQPPSSVMWPFFAILGAIAIVTVILAWRRRRKIH